MCELTKSSSNALDPTLSFMQYLEDLQLLKYLVGFNTKRVGIQMAEDQSFMSPIVFKQMCELMESF